MKFRLAVALLGLAISFDFPTFAQQTATPEPKLRQQVLALDKKFDEAWTSKDAAAMAALYTEDAVIVRDDGGPIYGREAIDKYWQTCSRRCKTASTRANRSSTLLTL